MQILSTAPTRHPVLAPPGHAPRLPVLMAVLNAPYLPYPTQRLSSFGRQPAAARQSPEGGDGVHLTVVFSACLRLLQVHHFGQ
jgi:hypothetical protein